MRYALLCILAFGCGGSNKDWSKEALKPASCTLKGKAYEVQIPDGLDPLTFENQCTWKKDISAESFVEIRLMTGGSKTAADAKQFLPGHPADAKSEDLPGGGYVLTYSHDDKKLINADAVIPAGDDTVQCNASAANVKNPDDTQAWLAKICKTFKAK